MASIVLSSVGRSVGNMIMPGVGGRVFSYLGAQAGKEIDKEIGLTADTSSDNRLDSFSVQDSQYGLAIPVLYGRVRVAGNMIWASDLIESEHEEGGLGKGGGYSLSSSTSYTYSIHCAVALGSGEIGGIQTIWADSKIIYQNGVWKSGVVGSASVYTGASDQDVDPLMESYCGSGNVPAYRGMAYIVLESLELSNFGNRIPNLSFEVIPKTITGNPEWLGAIDPSLSISGYTNLHGGALPLTIEGGSVTARTVLTCGYELEGGVGRFVICEVDVSGDTPVELVRTVGPGCSMGGVASHHWALAPDGRFVFIGFQDSVAPYHFYMMIYDSQARVFGTPFSIDMEYLDYRQILWIDPQRVVFTETQGDMRGLRVMMRAGLSVVDLGFYNVWGIGSKLGRRAVGFAQFVPCDDGFLHITANAQSNFTCLYAVPISWVDNDLVVGASYILSNNIVFSSGSAPYNRLLQTGEEEWTFIHTCTTDISLMSFVPGKEASYIKRNWTMISVDDTYGIAKTLAPVAFGNHIIILEKPYYDIVYRLTDIALTEGGFDVVVDQVEVDNADTSEAYFSLSYIGANRMMFLAHNNEGNWGNHAIIRRRNTGDTLDHIVCDLLLRAGYEAEDFDVSALAGIEVDGYVISREMSASSSLALLQYYEPFDLVERDGQLVAVRRGTESAIEIDVSETGADEWPAVLKKPLASLAQTRAQEMDLPVELTVDVLDASRDYEVGTYRARRLSAQGGPRGTKVTLPIVCTATKAKRIAARLLYQFWAMRTSYNFALSHAFLELDPADVVSIEGHKIRITEIIAKGGVLAVTGVSAEGDALLSEVDAESGSYDNVSSLSVVPSVLYLMDIPLLRNEDNQSGVYVAVTGSDGWSGATLWRSADGANFTEKTSFDKPAIAGTATSSLADGICHYYDFKNTVRVQLYQGTLSSCSEEQLLDGANVALLGGEIIQYRTASLIEPGLYELSGLLRGRQGTENQASTHRIGEAFVVLSSTRVQFIPALLSERNVRFHFRAVSYGMTIGKAVNLPITYDMETLRPLAPVHISGVRVSGAGSDCEISWVRRARMNASWVDYIDVPLDEEEELYDVEITDNGSVLRVFENVADCEILYSADNQSEDWPLGIPETFSVTVYQRSARYGRGASGSAEV
ncbi:MAG: phage tail protein [Bdellovibrionales bacterium]